jgi:ligand-binding SRPBCC domain-containing protein
VATDQPHAQEPLRRLVRSQIVPPPPDEAFAFFADVRNLEAITPPWLRFRVLTQPPVVLEAGALVDFRLDLHRAPISWRTRIEAWEPGRRFVDVQVRGPFAHWEHLHTFEPVEGGTLIADHVRYRMPYGPLGEAVHGLIVGRDLERIFDFRREAVARLLGRYPPAR